MRLLGPLPADVLEVVSEMTGMDPAHILDRRRSGYGTTPRNAQARLIGYWVSREFGASFPEIGREFGGRTHKSIISGVQRVEADPSLKALAIEVAHEVQERFGSLPKSLAHERCPKA